MREKWWKDSVIYQIYIKSFQDSNGDGVGDIGGIIKRIPYLKELGVDAVWMTPFMDSPNVDNGYDVRDYRRVLEEFGTMDDLRTMIHLFHENGMKVIMDMVVNHSSNQHRWFQDAVRNEASPYQNYYIWRKGKSEEQPPNNWNSFFSESAWTYVPERNKFYLHLFAKEQPDLNWENESLRKEVADIMKFWLEEGIDGFRMDVIGLIGKDITFPDGTFENDLEMIGTQYYSNLPQTHQYLQELRQRLDSEYNNIVFIGETTYATVDDAYKYICEKPELDMILQSELMEVDADTDKWIPKQADLKEMKQIITKWQISHNGQIWNSIFLGNHDKPRCVSRFGNSVEYREKSAKLLSTLLLTLRGTPIIYQGDELGMTNGEFEDISQFDDVETRNFWNQEVVEKKRNAEAVMQIISRVSRDNSRTPMQWSEEKNGGFSTEKPWIRMNSNYHIINAAEEKKDPESVLNYYKDMIALRKKFSTLRTGKYQELLPDHPTVFSYFRENDERRLWVVLNMSDYKVENISVPEVERKKVLCISNDSERKLKGSLEKETKISLSPWEADVWQIE